MALGSCSQNFRNKSAAFEAAIRNRRHFDNNTLLLAYAYYKQATEGDNISQAPSALNFKAKAKWDAWAKLKGLSCLQADSRYVEMMTKLGV